MLALGANEKLKAAAIKELAGPAAAADRTAIGDAWWDLAEKHQGLAAEQLQARAVYWYRQALPELTGLMKAKVDKRLGQYEAIEARATEKPAEPAEVIGKHPAKYQPGLVTELFNDPTFGKPVKVRIDSDIQCRWGFNPPDAAVTSTRFGVRWRGYVKPLKAGRYTFHADCRGNVRVLIDGALLINSQRSNLRGLNEGEVTLTATYHLIEVDFVQIFSPPECSLSWRPAGGNGNEPIAAASFFHDRQQAQAAGVGK
jgi:hypothetical protein